MWSCTGQVKEEVSLKFDVVAWSIDSYSIIKVLDNFLISRWRQVEQFKEDKSESHWASAYILRVAITGCKFTMRMDGWLV